MIRNKRKRWSLALASGVEMTTNRIGRSIVTSRASVTGLILHKKAVAELVEVTANSISRHFDKLNNRLYFYSILIIIFFIIPISPQEAVREINYQSIKQMIQSGYLDRALKDTEELLKENPGDATLALYQAEIWLDKGERFYQRRKYKSAFNEFEKVYKVWSNHAFVRLRYLELKDKRPLIDYEDKVSLTSLVPIGLQGTGTPENTEMNSSKPTDEENADWKGLDAKDKILYKHIIRLENFLVVSLILLGVINVSLLYIISKKR